MRIQIGLLLLVISASASGTEPREVPPGWKGQLVEALQQADRIVVKPGDQTGPDAPVLWQTSGRKQIDGFLNALEIEDAKSGMIDGCGGDPHFYFSAGDSVVAVISWHHGQTIRWRDGKWRGDALLAARSQRELPAWLARQGFAAVQEARQRDLAQKRERAEQARSFASFFPRCANRFHLAHTAHFLSLNFRCRMSRTPSAT